jgi:hypothetical protein
MHSKVFDLRRNRPRIGLVGHAERVLFMEMEKGTKHDEGKPPLDLLDRIALVETARVMAHGAKKYSTFNWRKGLTQRQTCAAALRHIYQHLDGEDLDTESGLLHLAHAACEVMFAIRMLMCRPDLDDRYKPQPVKKLEDYSAVEQAIKDFYRSEE